MLTLRDFIHLPQLDPLIEAVAEGNPGLVLVTGLDSRPTPIPESSQQPAVESDLLLPSGRAAIFQILAHAMVQRAISPRLVVVARDKSLSRLLPGMRRRTTWLSAESPEQVIEALSEASAARPSLLLVDHLPPGAAAAAALKAAQTGLRVVAQFDSVLHGAEAARHFAGLNPAGMALSSLAWIISIRRLPTLCQVCKQPVELSGDQKELFIGRYPDLAGLLDELCTAGKAAFSSPGRCSRCRDSGRHGDIAAFDVFEAGQPAPELFHKHSRLSLEEYLLRLAAAGYLPLDDLLNLQNDTLRRTFNLLSAVESERSGAGAALNRKLAELEAANRVLVQRTSVLVSLQELAEDLIHSADLVELAFKVCRRASDLCGADRAVLYFWHQVDNTDQAEVLAVSGWDASLVHRPVESGLLIKPGESGTITPFAGFPPGIPPPRKQTDQDRPLMAGLRVPLMAGDRQVGLMVVHSTFKSQFTPGESALLQTFANQAALAIQRAGLVDDLRQKIAQLEKAQAELVKKERMERELELARQVQQSVLPRTFPSLPGFAFAAGNEPARQVGGDFYDVIRLDGRGANARFGLVIGDVSDKGLPAALYMALTRSLILAEARRDLSPKRVLENVNNLLQDLGDPTGFVTVFYAVLEPSQRRLTFSRAGHDRPYLLRTGTISALGGEGSALGIFRGDEFHLTEESLDLLPGDRLVLYTDGLCDVLDASEQFFGLEKLESLFRELAGLPAKELCEIIFARLAEYQGPAERFDDMTLLILEVLDQ